jgi:outer membrane protein
VPAVLSMARTLAAAIALASPTPAPIRVPTPAPVPTAGGTPIPYPAYGTPAPDVAALTPKPGIPQSISLDQATELAVALSPVFAAQNAAWRAIHAKYTSEQQAVFPGLSGSATMGNAYSNGTTTSGTQNGSGAGGATAAQAPDAASRSSVGSYTRSSLTSESAAITITQLIYDGGRTIAAIRAAKTADVAGRATLLRQLQTLALNVANAYYAVLEDNATVAADAQLVREFEVNEASVEAQIRNGAAARSDLAAAQFQVAQARGALVSAQGTAIAAQAAFATALGLDADTRVVPKPLSARPAPPTPTYGKALRRALLLRPDYIAAKWNQQSAQENLRFAKLARFPVLTAAASDGASRLFIDCIDTAGAKAQASAALCPGPSGWSNDKTLGLTLSIPIYDQGLTNYNVAVAASALDQADAVLRQTKLQVESDVRAALASLISARASLVQAQAELTGAKVSLDATQAQYKVGATTILNVVTAEANLSTAQATYIAALYGVQTAEQNYLYATGQSDIRL